VGGDIQMGMGTVSFTMGTEQIGQFALRHSNRDSSRVCGLCVVVELKRAPRSFHRKGSFCLISVPHFISSQLSGQCDNASICNPINDLICVRAFIDYLSVENSSLKCLNSLVIIRASQSLVSLIVIVVVHC